MCVCRPEVRTPFCGRPGCVAPPQRDVASRADILKKLNASGGDPVHVDSDGKWWFYDESWTARQGPFDSEIEANDALRRYCDEVLGR